MTNKLKFTSDCPTLIFSISSLREHNIKLQLVSNEVPKASYFVGVTRSQALILACEHITSQAPKSDGSLSALAATPCYTTYEFLIFFFSFLFIFDLSSSRLQEALS
jgi:hypothetical protein